MSEIMQGLTRRCALDGDAVLFYRLYVDSTVQRFIATPKHRITWQDHVDWFCGHFATAEHWYVGELNRRPIGVLRLDRGEGDRWWTSLVIDGCERGKGYGVELLRMAPNIRAYANIHKLNMPSLRVFEKAGYVYDHNDGTWRIYRKEPA